MSKRYELCITTTDDYQFINSKDRVKFFVTAMHWHLIKTVPEGIPYELHLEVSTPDNLELETCGRLHYHGYLTLSQEQYANYFVDWSRKLTRIGRVTMKPIKHEEEYAAYVIKQHDMILPIATHNKVPVILTDQIERPQLSYTSVLTKGQLNKLGLPTDVQCKNK